jgi:RimJ/RimL family protein N-acetyltransferase
MNLELLTERTKLTPLTITDIDIAVEMFTDPDVVKYIGGEVMSKDEVQKGMSTWIRRGGDGCIGIWCISNRETGEKYGDCYLLPIPIEEDDTNWDIVIPEVIPEGDIEIGYFLKKSAWGKGIATEVCRRLLKFAFEDTPLKKLVATIDDENHISKKVLEKAGFVYKGRMRAYAENNPYYCIDREQWVDHLRLPT